MQKIENLNKEHHIFAEDLDPGAIDQFREAMSHDFSVKGAIMPDAHLGYTLPIGGVVAAKDVVVPGWVGYDIGCGVCALKTEFKKDEIEAHKWKIFEAIDQVIPNGVGEYNKKPEDWDTSELAMSETLKKIFKDSKGLHQLCTLGSGNHFIEVDFDEDENVWIVVHSGSRGIGHKVAGHYMSVAKGLNGKKTGKKAEGTYALSVDSPEGMEYIKDMNFCLTFALENRKRMVDKVRHEIERCVNGAADESEPVDFEKKEANGEFINRNHNHAEEKDGLWIHRKGATHAEKGMLGVIPGDMKEGCFIVEGTGNPKSLWSSSHGAGRKMSRRKAKKTIGIGDFKASMQGIAAKITEKVLDEAPGAYKDIHRVMELQKDLVEIRHHLKLIVNVKGG